MASLYSDKSCVWISCAILCLGCARTIHWVRVLGFTNQNCFEKHGPASYMGPVIRQIFESWHFESCVSESWPFGRLGTLGRLGLWRLRFIIGVVVILVTGVGCARCKTSVCWSRRSVCNRCNGALVKKEEKGCERAAARFAKRLSCTIGLATYRHSIRS